MHVYNYICVYICVIKEMKLALFLPAGREVRTSVLALLSDIA